MTTTLFAARRIHTLDAAARESSDEPATTGVVATDGVIVAVGDAAELKRQLPAGADVVDFGDAVLTPGLVDGHSHPVWGVELARGVDFTDALDLAAVRRLLADARATLAPGEWLLGYALNPVVFGGEAPTIAALGPAAGGVPTLLTLYDAHSVLASAEALAAAGITGPIDFGDAHGEVVCDTRGVPTGHLLEAAGRLAQDVRPELDPPQRLAELRNILAGMAASGLTGTHAMDFRDPAGELMETIERDGELPLRLGFNPILDPDDGGTDLVKALQTRRGRRWRVEGVKLFVDGTVDGGTAWLEEPDTCGQGLAPHWLDFEAFRGAVTDLHRSGVNVAVHSIGDRATREVAVLLAELRHTYGPLARHRIEHIETLPDATVELLGAGAAAASQQPLHCTRFNHADGSDSWSQRLGPERTAHGFRTGDLRRAGATVALGSDWPISAYDPRWIMADAQLRRRVGHPEITPIGPEQALTPRQALEGYTTHAALASGEEDHRGRVAVGYDADFTVFADDPLEITPDELGAVGIVATVVNGEASR